jgi:hypothetical protein
MIFVLAGTNEEAKTWAHENSVPDTDWKYIESPRTLLGWRRQPFVRVGTYASRPDALYIFDTLKIKHFKHIGE